MPASGAKSRPTITTGLEMGAEFADRVKHAVLRHGSTLPEQAMAKRVLIVSYHFYPDTAVGARRMSELARHLHRCGMEVVVVAAKSFRNQAVDPQLMANFPELRCVRIIEPPKLLPLLLLPVKRLLGGRNKANLRPDAGAPSRDPRSQDETRLRRWKRLFHSLEHLIDGHKLWSLLTAGRLAWFAVGKPFDVVISSGPPMSAHLAVLLARPLLRCRWIMDLRDPWCDQDFGRPDLHSSVSRRLNRRVERRAFASADEVCATTPGYRDLLRANYPGKRQRIHLLLNGYDGAIESLPPPQGKLELLYAGTLYYNRNPFPLLEALTRLLHRPEVDRNRVRFRLFGPSRSWGGIDIAAWLTRQQLQDCVSLHPPVPAAEVRRLMARANVLVNFAQGQPLQIPAKMLDCLALRRDMLLITEPDSDSAWLARQANCGHAVPPGDVSHMAAVLVSLYRKYTQSPAPAEFGAARVLPYSRAKQNEDFVALLEGLAPARREVSP